MKNLELELNNQLQNLKRKKKFQFFVNESEEGKRLNLKIVDLYFNYQHGKIPTEATMTSIQQAVEKTIREYPEIHDFHIIFNVLRKHF